MSSRQLYSHLPFKKIKQNSHRLGKGRLDVWLAGKDNKSRAPLLQRIGTRHTGIDDNFVEAKAET